MSPEKVDYLQWRFVKVFLADPGGPFISGEGRVLQAPSITFLERLDKLCESHVGKDSPRHGEVLRAARHVRSVRLLHGRLARPYSAHVPREGAARRQAGAKPADGRGEEGEER